VVLSVRIAAISRQGSFCSRMAGKQALSELEYVENRYVCLSTNFGVVLVGGLI
jgi:hypothetical protein